MSFPFCRSFLLFLTQPPKFLLNQLSLLNRLTAPCQAHLLTSVGRCYDECPLDGESEGTEECRGWPELLALVVYRTEVRIWPVWFLEPTSFSPMVLGRLESFWALLFKLFKYTSHHLHWFVCFVSCFFSLNTLSCTSFHAIKYYSATSFLLTASWSTVIGSARWLDV